MRIGLVGGGSGGHFYPLIAVAQELSERVENPELYYYGPEPYNTELLQTYNIRFSRVPAGKVRRYFSVLNVLDTFRTFWGLLVALAKLYWHYPDVILTRGSYASVPIVLAAWFYRIPIVVQESDVKPGRANRLAGRFAKYIAISWAPTAEYFKSKPTALTGIPIRREIRQEHPSPHQALGIPNDLPLLYVTGGSLGAERINTLILNSLDELLPHMRIYHQTGDTHIETVKKTARELLKNKPQLLEYYYAVGTANATTVNALLSAARIVITRAGTTTLYEIAIHKKPAIVIPIPEDVSHDQRTNAYTYARNGAAVVIEERNLTEHLLQTELFSMLTDVDAYRNMQAATQEIADTNAAVIISEALLRIGQEHGS